MSSEVVGRLPHECVRDSLPSFDSSWFQKHEDGEIVRCQTCGTLWLVTSGKFCHYRKLSRRQIKRLIREGALDQEAPNG